MGKTRADAVWRETEQRLFRLIAGDDAAIRGQLANLRRGAGRVPGDDPKVWGILFAELPEDMLGRHGVPSREEWAIYTALTLYAVLQQGNDPKQHNMYVPDASLGLAAGRLVKADGGDDDSRERVARRFHQVALAQDMPAMVYYLRSFIQLLRAENIGLDIPMLARNLYLYQIPGGAASVRLQWGQDFYRKGTDDQENRKEEES